MLRFSLFPYGKIVRSTLVALSVQFTGAFQGIVQITSAEHAVMVGFIVFPYIEIHAAVADVGITGVKNLFYGFYLFNDMTAGPRLYARRSDIELAHGLVVTESISLNHFHRLELLQSGFF